MDTPVIPLASWISNAISWLQFNGAAVFDVFTSIISWMDDVIRWLLNATSPFVVMAIVTLVIVYRRHYYAAIISCISLVLIWNLKLWPQAMDTVSLMVISCVLAIAIGFPLGVLIAESNLGKRVISPILDFMQTTPAFVYLIPAVLFFGVGTTPGVLATAVFAAPAMAKAVALGISEVKYSLTEAAEAFGASKLEILCKIKLPLSRHYIATGASQCIMMALSMVVICALIGARGLGVEVVSALSQMDLPHGLESGISVVFLAFVIDQLCRSESQKR